MVLAFLTLYNKELGYSIEQGGWVVAIYGVGSFVGALVGGQLVDKFGFYRVQFAALFFGGLLFIVLGQMNSYLMICICTFVLSMVNESFRPANATAIAHYSTSKNRTQSFSLVRLAINLGWGIGIAVGGFLASIDYGLLFWVDGFTNIVAAILLVLVLPRISLRQQKVVGEQTEVTTSTISPYRNKPYLFFLLCIVLFGAAFFQVFTTVPVFFKGKLALDEYWIGVVMAINGLVIALLEMVIVFKLEGRRRYLVLITFGTVLMGLSFLLLNLPLSNGFIVAVLAILLLTLAEMISMPFMNSYYISKSTEVTRGKFAGMYTMAWSAAQVIGSSSGSWFADTYGFTNLWCCTAAVCMIAAAGFYALLKSET